VTNEIRTFDGDMYIIDLEQGSSDTSSNDDNNLRDCEPENLQEDGEQKQGRVWPCPLEDEAQRHQNERASSVGRLVKLDQQLEVEEHHRQLLDWEEDLSHLLILITWKIFLLSL
jgi:hypothetical protein